MKYEKNERANLLSADEDIDFILGENEQVLWEGKSNKKGIRNKQNPCNAAACVAMAYNRYGFRCYGV